LKFVQTVKFICMLQAIDLQNLGKSGNRECHQLELQNLC
jgi:hypothetical protein